MSHRFAALSVVLGAVLLTASGAALWVGASDALVTLAGPKKRLEAAALPPSTRGWFELAGCVRHDLGVVVTADGTVYRLGEPGPDTDDSDRTYTPIAAREDCDEDKPPKHIYALLEDAEGSGTTLGRSAPTRVAPPPIPAQVNGTIGPRIGDTRKASKARRKLDAAIAGLMDAPVLHKDGHPGELWVALFTAGAGVHGLLLLALGARYLRRRGARREAMRDGLVDDSEEQFFRTETLD